MLQTQIVYFSISENNRLLAQQITKHLGCPIAEIVPRENYSKSYSSLVNRAKSEQFLRKKVSIYPLQLDPSITNLIIVTPIWYADLPRPVVSFIKQINQPIKKITLISKKFMSGYGLCLHTLQRNAPAAIQIQSVSNTMKLYKLL